MLWKAAQICPDFPMTEKQALKRIEDYKSKNGKAEHIDKVKDELTPVSTFSSSPVE